MTNQEKQFTRAIFITCSIVFSVEEDNSVSFSSFSTVEGTIFSCKVITVGLKNHFLVNLHLIYQLNNHGIFSATTVQQATYLFVPFTFFAHTTHTVVHVFELKEEK